MRVLCFEDGGMKWYHLLTWPLELKRVISGMLMLLLSSRLGEK